MDKALTEFIDKLRSAIKKRTYVKLLLTKRVLGNQDLNKIVVRYVELSGKPHLQFVYKYDRNDEAKNFPLEDGITQLQSIIGNNFLDNILYTTKEDLNLRYNSNGGKIVKAKPTFTEAADGSHDEAKKRLLDTKKSVYFKSLGITDNKGDIIPSMNAKYKQVEKFVEIIDSLADNVKDCSPVKIADMGCGKGYLTFATYDYLTNNRELAVDMKGVETQENLVKFCNNIAQKSSFGGLEFVQSNINDYKPGNLDILIALHACDTATDEALARGVEWRARYIVSAPCCQHELQKTLGQTGADTSAFAGVLRHGILRERLCDILTDSFRAMILRILGFKTQVVEFVSPDATARNILLRAEYGVKPGQGGAVSDYLNLRDWWRVTPWLETRLSRLLEKHLSRY